MPAEEPRYRLCIYCRALELASEPCKEIIKKRTNPASFPSSPCSNASVLTSGLSSEDARLIQSLQEQPSSLCTRCADYKIIDVYTNAQPLDQIQLAQEGDLEIYRNASALYNKEISTYRLSLGLPSSVFLTPSCQLCRLLYCVLPRVWSPDERQIHIEPYRAHIRQEGWEMFPDKLKGRCAILLGLADPWTPFTPASDPFRAGDLNIRYAMMTGPAIALETQCTPPDRRLLNVKRLESVLDLDLLLKPLQHCEQNHVECSRVEKPVELLTTRMVDVLERKVVSCPKNCDYVALSYVWGGIQPTPDALEGHHLPQTIEDAITVTKALGRRYLWVDALCIDQSKDPSPEVLARKIKQLNLMATIYGCATITLIALTGKNSNAGLAGVSLPRPTHSAETIDGHTLITTPQYISLDRETAEWSSRAWCLQEELLSRRLLHFAESQVDFSCLCGSVWEGVDTTTAPEEFTAEHPSQQLMHMVTSENVINSDVQLGGNIGTYTSLEGRMRLFDGVLQTYTSRRMTNESDSLNAFLGMLTGFSSRLFPEGFMFGLPLLSHPASIGWIHHRQSKPKRRALLPSWSWAGWEGTALIPGDLLNMFDGSGETSTIPDLEMKILSLDGNTLIVEGWTVNLNIKTEPFSEVFVPELNESIATVMEGNLLHNNSLPTGCYSCLLVQRQCERNSNRSPPRQKAFMLVLDCLGEAVQRRTMITVTLFAGYDLRQMKLEKRIVKLV